MDGLVNGAQMIGPRRGRKDSLMPDQVRFIVVNDARFYHPRFSTTRTRTHTTQSRHKTCGVSIHTGGSM